MTRWDRVFYWSQPVVAVAVVIAAVYNWRAGQVENQIHPTLAQILHAATLPFAVGTFVSLIVNFEVLRARRSPKTTPSERALLILEYALLAIVLTLPTIGEVTRANGLVAVGVVAVLMLGVVWVAIAFLVRTATTTARASSDSPTD